MFLNWSYGSFLPQNGLTQLTIVFLFFWAYPLFGVMKGKKVNRRIGLGCALGAFIATFCYIFSRNAEIFGGFINLAGNGPWVLLFSSLALGVGVYQCDSEYRKEITSPSSSLPSENWPPK